ncbi:related to integral membrane protein PTH11 [Cephalotrichum gorgonifer]|uniref:Related to integral membrane protein PTH11 n=1 Tax=Cephalotrichum gorgonifer TaxID=2041049 RepID=A0AAE8N6R8_9PEZI|nr:related to integral membrane protein PTH11 [Cephalotrichum gorgonifer]
MAPGQVFGLSARRLFDSGGRAAHEVGAKYGGLTNSYMTDEQRAAVDPNSVEYYNRQMGSKVQVVGWNFYAAILWGLKFCVTTFYSRLTSGLHHLQHLKTRVYIAYGILSVTYLTVVLTLCLSCRPIQRFWQIHPDPGPLCRPANSPAYVMVVAIPNILTDVYLLSIPLPLLWGVNISVRRRLTLMFLFSGALFIMMASIIRAVVISTAGLTGAIDGSQWACRETFVAIVVTNLPIIHPIIRKGAKKIGLSALFSRSRDNGQSHELRSKGTGIGRFGGSSNAKTTLSRPGITPQTTAWGSDEDILSQQAGDGESWSKIKEEGKGILVTQEIGVHSETVPGNNDPAANDWGYSSSRTDGSYRA